MKFTVVLKIYLSMIFVEYQSVLSFLKCSNIAFYVDSTKYFTSSNNRLGFKKAVSCSHAIYTLRTVVDHYISNGSTVNLCALDVSKAFDKINHHGLFIKPMNRLVPLTLLLVQSLFHSGYLVAFVRAVFYRHIYLLCILTI